MWYYFEINKGYEKNCKSILTYVDETIKILRSIPNILLLRKMHLHYQDFEAIPY